MASTEPPAKTEPVETMATQVFQDQLATQVHQVSWELLELREQREKLEDQVLLETMVQLDQLEQQVPQEWPVQRENKE